MGRNLEIVRGFHEKFSEADFEVLRDALAQPELRELPSGTEELWRFASEHVHPEISLENRASSFSLPDIPQGTALHGWSGWLRFWRAWLAPWDRFETHFRNFEELGDNVVLDFMVDVIGTESGLSAHLALAPVWTVKDGKVLRVQVFDTREEALAAAESDE